MGEMSIVTPVTCQFSLLNVAFIVQIFRVSCSHLINDTNGIMRTCSSKSFEVESFLNNAFKGSGSHLQSQNMRLDTNNGM